MASKFYAVKVGSVPGIYKTWDECKAVVDGYPKAEYKSFKLLNEAIEYLGVTEEEQEEVVEQPVTNKAVRIVDVYVDGSYRMERRIDGKKNYSFGIVVVENDEVIYSNYGLGENEEAASMHNVAGELAGAMRGLIWCMANGVRANIHHDYEGVGKWARKEWKAKNKWTQAYVNFMNTALAKACINEFIWVKGHSGNKYNELADKLAAKAFEEA